MRHAVCEQQFGIKKVTENITLCVKCLVFLLNLSHMRYFNKFLTISGVETYCVQAGARYFRNLCESMMGNKINTIRLCQQLRFIAFIYYRQSCQEKEFE